MSQLHSALQQISAMEGVPEEEIISEMETAIAEAYYTSLSTGNKELIAIWREMSDSGVPTVYEFISFVTYLIQQDVFDTEMYKIRFLGG